VESGIGIERFGLRWPVTSGCCIRRGCRFEVGLLGATSLVRQARINPEKAPWVAALLARRPARVVTVAVANKLTRIAWAVLSRGESFRRNLPTVA